MYSETAHPQDDALCAEGLDISPEISTVSPSCYKCDVSKLIIAAVRSQGAIVKGAKLLK